MSNARIQFSLASEDVWLAYNPQLKEGDRIEVIGGEQHMSWKWAEAWKPIINHIEFVHEYPRFILVKVFVGGIDEHSYMETIHKSACRYLGIKIKPVV